MFVRGRKVKFGLNKDQAELWSDKLMDLANFIALSFGVEQIVRGRVKIFLLIGGAAIYLVLTIFSLYLRRR